MGCLRGMAKSPRTVGQYAYPNIAIVPAEPLTMLKTRSCLLKAMGLAYVVTVDMEKA